MTSRSKDEPRADNENRDEDMNRLGAVLSDLRRRAGLSQSELAHRTKLSGAYISQLETGVRGGRVSLTTIGKLAKALGVDRSVLLGAMDRKPTSGIDRPTLEDFIATEPTLNASEKAFLLQLIDYFRSDESVTPKRR